MRNGWQKLNAMRQARGGTTARMGNLSFLNIVTNSEFEPTCDTVVVKPVSTKAWNDRYGSDLPLSHADLMIPWR